VRTIATLACLLVCAAVATAEAKPVTYSEPPPGGSHVAIAGQPLVHHVREERPEPQVLDLAVGLSTSAVRDDAQIGDADSTFTFFENVRMVVGREVGWAAGGDLMLGTTSEGGFVYELNMYVAGVGLRSERGAVSVLAGGGMSGITGDRLGFAVQLPVELHAVVCPRPVRVRRRRTPERLRPRAVRRRAARGSRPAVRK
jgi:hypothetical protein